MVRAVCVSPAEASAGPRSREWNAGSFVRATLPPAFERAPGRSVPVAVVGVRDPPPSPGGGLSKVPSLLFDMDLDAGGGGGESLGSGSGGPASYGFGYRGGADAGADSDEAAERVAEDLGPVGRKIRSLLSPDGEDDALLRAHVRFAVEDAARRGRGPPTPRELARLLRRLGYEASARRARGAGGGGGGSACLRNLRHAFVEVSVVRHHGLHRERSLGGGEAGLAAAVARARQQGHAGCVAPPDHSGVPEAGPLVLPVPLSETPIGGLLDARGEDAGDVRTPTRELAAPDGCLRRAPSGGSISPLPLPVVNPSPRPRSAALRSPAARPPTQPPRAVKYVVDPRFREQFEAAACDERYARVLSLVPRAATVRADELPQLVAELCSEMAASFKALGLTLPPWRATSSALSKWQATGADDEGDDDEEAEAEGQTPEGGGEGDIPDFDIDLPAHVAARTPSPRAPLCSAPGAPLSRVPEGGAHAPPPLPPIAPALHGSRLNPAPGAAGKLAALPRVARERRPARRGAPRPPAPPASVALWPSSATAESVALEADGGRAAAHILALRALNEDDLLLVGDLETPSTSEDEGVERRAFEDPGAPLCVVGDPPVSRTRARRIAFA